MIKIKWSDWHQYLNLEPKEYICGYCGHRVASTFGYIYNSNFIDAHIYICTNCGIPTFFYKTEQYPGSIVGKNIESLPRDVEQIYQEIRDSIKNNSYTSALLLGRKLIMHLAVNIAKAKEGEAFVTYVEYLKNSGYIPPNGDKILNYIKDLGNEKNHEIKIGKKEEAQKILQFIEGLLIFIYEFPSNFPDPIT